MKITNPFVPTFASTVLARIALGVGVSTVAIAIASAVSPQPTFAQSAGSAGALGEFTTPQSEQDSLTGGIGGNGGLSVFDLIHRAQLGGLRDPNEVINGQRESIDKATAEYRRIQLEQLGNPQLRQLGEQPQGTPANSPATSPMGY